MASYTQKAPSKLHVAESGVSTFYSGTSKNDGSKSVSSFKGKYKFGILNTVSSNPNFAKPQVKKELPSPLIMNEISNDLLLKNSRSNFSSPKLAPIPPLRGRNTQSVDYTNFNKSIFGKDSKDDDSLEYQRIMAQKTGREDSVYQDEKPTDIVGTEAVTNFYSHYKKLDKILDQNSFKDIKDSMYTSFLRRSEDLHLFPSKIGLIKPRGERAKIMIEYIIE